MVHRRWVKQELILFRITFILSVLAIDAWARVGGGRSFGSRGSRSLSMPPSSAPAPAGPHQGAREYLSPTQPSPASYGGGGFLRSLAGGIMGGVLGGMLLRSLGLASGNGGVAGGIGLLDILLIGALLYGIFVFIGRRRHAQIAANDSGTVCREAQASNLGQAFPAGETFETATPKGTAALGLRHLRQMDPRFDEKTFTDGALDLFSRIQDAWATI